MVDKLDIFLTLLHGCSVDIAVSCELVQKRVPLKEVANACPHLFGSLNMTRELDVGIWQCQEGDLLGLSVAVGQDDELRSGLDDIWCAVFNWWVFLDIDVKIFQTTYIMDCLLYTSPSPRD